MHATSEPARSSASSSILKPTVLRHTVSQTVRGPSCCASEPRFRTQRTAAQQHHGLASSRPSTSPHLPNLRSAPPHYQPSPPRAATLARAATPCTATLAASNSAPVIQTRGYQRSLEKMREADALPPRTARLPRPLLHVDLVPPRTFPLPPRRTVTGCSDPLSREATAGETLGCGASCGGMLTLDHTSKSGGGPVHTAAKRRWNLCRQVFLVTMERKVELLQGTGILDGCSHYDLVRLAATMQLTLVGRMRRLVRQYEHPAFFAIVLRGSLEVRDVNCGVLKLGEGECFGIEALGAHYGEAIPSLRTVMTITPVLMLVHLLPADLMRASGGYVPGQPLARPASQQRQRPMWTLVDAAWLDKLLSRQRKSIETHLIATLILRMRQFSHLRFLLPLRLRLAALLSIELIPAGTPIICEGARAVDVNTYFLLQGQLAIFIADKLKAGGQMRVGQISYRDLKAHVGDLATFSDTPASATVMTEGKCVCLVLRREQADAFAELLPEFQQNATLMARELLRLHSSSWSGFQDALEVKTVVEASKHKVNRLLAVERVKLLKAHQARKESADPPIALPPLLRIKDVELDQDFVPPADCDALPAEVVKSMRRRSNIKRSSELNDVVSSEGVSVKSRLGWLS